MQSKKILVPFLAMFLLTVGYSSRADFFEEVPDMPRWYFSPGMGTMIYQGNEPLMGGLRTEGHSLEGAMLNLRLGYHYSEWWTLEGGMLLVPFLSENYVGITDFRERIEARGDMHRLKAGYEETDGVIKGRISSARKSPHFGETWMTTFYGDALFHFSRWERLDPYLAGGIGLVVYGEDVLDHGGRYDLMLRAGYGLMYHFNDEWAIRGDWRLLMTTDGIMVNTQADAGVVWTWGARTPPDYFAVGGPAIDDVLAQRPEPDFELMLNFDLDSAQIKPGFFSLINEVAEALRQRPGSHASIEGHADQMRSSSARYNQRLSHRRADAVKEYLVRQCGIDPSRLTTVGHGFEKPKVTPNLDSGTPENRRVEIFIKDGADVR